jgi:hypothetical protein
LARSLIELSGCFPKNGAVGERNIKRFGESELRWKIGAGGHGPFGGNYQEQRRP